MPFSNLTGSSLNPSFIKQMPHSATNTTDSTEKQNPLLESRNQLTSIKVSDGKVIGQSVNDHNASRLSPIKTKTTTVPQRALLMCLLLGADMRQSHAHRPPPKTHLKPRVKRDAYLYFNDTDNACRLKANTRRPNAFDRFTQDIISQCPTISDRPAPKQEETLTPIFRNLFLNSALACEKKSNRTQSLDCLDQISDQFIDESRLVAAQKQRNHTTNLQAFIGILTGMVAFIAIATSLSYCAFGGCREESTAPSDGDTVATDLTDDIEEHQETGVELTERTQPLSESTYPSISRNIDS